MGIIINKILLAFYIPTYLYVSTNVCIYANFALAGVSSGEVKKGQFLSMWLLWTQIFTTSMPDCSGNGDKS